MSPFLVRKGARGREHYTMGNKRPKIVIKRTSNGKFWPNQALIMIEDRLKIRALKKYFLAYCAFQVGYAKPARSPLVLPYKGQVS